MVVGLAHENCGFAIDLSSHISIIRDLKLVAKREW